MYYKSKIYIHIIKIRCLLDLYSQPVIMNRKFLQPVIAKSQPVITNLKTGHHYGAIMDRIKMANISSNKWQYILKFVCVDNRSALLTLTLLTVTSRLFRKSFNCRYNPRMDYAFCLLTLKSSEKWWSPYIIWKHFFIEFLKVICLYFGKPEVNRADLSCIFSLREK
jgi:hypothetical protein